MSDSTDKEEEPADRPTPGASPHDAPTLAADGIGVSDKPAGPITFSGIEAPGATIGPYTLLEILGEGGFGTVWRARQSQPVKREVALKVIKPGRDSAEVIRRFGFIKAGPDKLLRSKRGIDE